MTITKKSHTHHTDKTHQLISAIEQADKVETDRMHIHKKTLDNSITKTHPLILTIKCIRMHARRNRLVLATYAMHTIHSMTHQLMLAME